MRPDINPDHNDNPIVGHGGEQVEGADGLAWFDDHPASDPGRAFFQGLDGPDHRQTVDGSGQVDIDELGRRILVGEG